MHDLAPVPTMSAPQELVLRCDASRQIGAGHVVRSLTLAEGWQAAGGAVTLVGRVEIPWLRAQIAHSAIRFLEIADDITSDQELSLLADLDGLNSAVGGCDDLRPWLVLDGYRFDASYHSRLRALGFQLCVIDDMAHLNAYDADVILNQNPNAAMLRYNCPARTVLLLGTAYALLRRQFRDLTLSPKQISPVARRLLVTFGGADTQRQWRKALDALHHIQSPSLTVTLVGAPQHLSTAAAADLPAQHTIEFLPNVIRMVDLMQQADVALCASGSTTLELAYLGVPMLVTSIADNQLGIMDGLAQSGAALALGWHEEITAVQIAAQLEPLLADSERRRQMSRAGQILVDGLGPERVIAAFLTSAS
ncbi:UDP-2,4-diacetamido-2,4,6-trideoxy-beta-L-altropyranose hydrolase [bacterium]|nr:UDP-2,4-diacetamido-2,4,6-trideoxy-beta-L-altropyranose hydrolase [bacterium]